MRRLACLMIGLLMLAGLACVPEPTPTPTVTPTPTPALTATPEPTPTPAPILTPEELVDEVYAARAIMAGHYIDGTPAADGIGLEWQRWCLESIFVMARASEEVVARAFYGEDLSVRPEYVQRALPIVRATLTDQEIAERFPAAVRACNDLAGTILGQSKRGR